MKGGKGLWLADPEENKGTDTGDGVSPLVRGIQEGVA
jgi:hypothetical protein